MITSEERVGPDFLLQYAMEHSRDSMSKGEAGKLQSKIEGLLEYVKVGHCLLLIGKHKLQVLSVLKSGLKCTRPL